MILTTDRLLLRPITTDDARAMYECYRGPNVGPNAGWKPHESVDETREIIEQIFLANNVFGIVLREDNALIGSVGLIDDPKRDNDRTKMLGYSIGEDYWGRGYMTEAARAVVDDGFVRLGLDLISAYCYPENARSRRVLTKLGFRYEGTLALCEMIYNGEVRANECYALTPQYFAEAGVEDN
ncbi:MAG: GNAT family N-acetyltransferase [Synergistaceae bacterium]|nr:GNAT family N-acetyltransferase [Synergistaceae bacterium]